MKLKFTANGLAAVEQALNKPLAHILTELESEDGASMTTLRALVAAGRAGTYSNIPMIFLDENTAGRLIDAKGVRESAEVVGKALAAYFKGELT